MLLEILFANLKRISRVNERGVMKDLRKKFGKRSFSCRGYFNVQRKMKELSTS